MFHADHTALQVIGHALIAFLFFYRGLAAFGEWEINMAVFRKRAIPYPEVVFGAGVAVIIVGGAMVLVDWYAAWAAWAAWALIVFVVAANWIYHDFWNMEGMEARVHTWIFCNNIAVAGGLVLVAAG